MICDEERKREDLERRNREMRARLQAEEPIEPAEEPEDDSLKNKMISELTLENRRLTEELTKTHYAKFRLEQDLQSKPHST